VLTPHVPPWAVAAGVPPPKPGESFEEVCRRLGIPDWLIDSFTDGLNEITEDIANARLASYLVVSQPEAFRIAVLDLRQKHDREKPPPPRPVPPPLEDPLAAALAERYS
jgi:hypothetical protein